MKLIFCNGQPKSGSTFLFNLVKRLVRHVELRTTNSALCEALDRCEPARSILHRELGEYTGFVDGSIAAAARAFSLLPLPIDSRLVLKVHDADPAPARRLPAGSLVITTFRDPIDVMVALRDQAMVESARPAGTARPAFIAIDSHATALTQTERFMARLVRSFSPHHWYMEYPSFIRPAPECAAMLATMLGVDPTQVVESAKCLDHEIRAGIVHAEFNRGEVGRGHQLVDELLRSGHLSPRLIRRAVARHRDLVDLVRRHRRGIAFRQ